MTHREQARSRQNCKASTRAAYLQSRLIELGYDTGGNDGQYGVLTRTAVAEFQAQYRLKVDGIAGPEVMGLLRADLPVLRCACTATYGDDLRAIAHRVSTTVEALVEANGAKILKGIHEGQRLFVHRRAAYVVDRNPPSIEGRQWTGSAVPAFKVTQDGVLTDLGIGPEDRGRAGIITDRVTPGDWLSSDATGGTGTFLRTSKTMVPRIVRRIFGLGLRGLLLDLIGVVDEDCGAFEALVCNLSRELRRRNMEFGLILPARDVSRADHDYGLLERFCSFIILLPPPSVCGYEDYYARIQRMCHEVPRWKLMAGVYVGHMAVEDGAAVPVSLEELERLKDRYTMNERYDEATGLRYLAYRRRGVGRRIWYEDSESIGWKLHAVNRLNILGVAYMGSGEAKTETITEISRRFIIILPPAYR